MANASIELFDFKLPLLYYKVMTKRWTKEQLIEAVECSNSIRAVLNKLGLRQAGGNYKFISQKIKDLNLNTSHFLGRAHLKGKSHNWAKKTTLEDILHIGTTLQPKWKKRLLSEGLLKNECVGCGISTWSTNISNAVKTITLEIDHINGNNQDNRLENLRILCPNCHSMTDTSRGRNLGKASTTLQGQTYNDKTERNRRNENGKLIYSRTKNLCNCGNKKLLTSKQCMNCNNLKKKNKIAETGVEPICPEAEDFKSSVSGQFHHSAAFTLLN